MAVPSIDNFKLVIERLSSSSPHVNDVLGAVRAIDSGGIVVACWFFASVDELAALKTEIVRCCVQTHAMAYVSAKCVQVHMITGNVLARLTVSFVDPPPPPPFYELVHAAIVASETRLGLVVVTDGDVDRARLSFSAAGLAFSEVPVPDSGAQFIFERNSTRERLLSTETSILKGNPEILLFATTTINK
jgi:hypothetical protein